MDNFNENTFNAKELDRAFQDIASAANALIATFNDLLEHTAIEGGHLCVAGEVLSAKIGYIADKFIPALGGVQVRGDADDWMDIKS
jgi:hypothetical protein